MLVADAELAELVGLTGLVVILAVLIAVLDDRLTSGAVDVGPSELGRLVPMFVVELRLIVGVRLIEVVRIAWAVMLVLVIIAGLPAGTITVGAVALEATRKLVIVVDRSIDDEELLTIGTVLLLHCMLW